MSWESRVMGVTCHGSHVSWELRATKACKEPRRLAKKRQVLQEQASPICCQPIFKSAVCSEGSGPYVQQRNAYGKEGRVGMACADRPRTDSRNRCKNGMPRRERWRSSETGLGGLHPEASILDGSSEMGHLRWIIRSGLSEVGLSTVDRPRQTAQDRLSRMDVCKNGSLQSGDGEDALKRAGMASADDRSRLHKPCGQEPTHGTVVT